MRIRGVGLTDVFHASYQPLIWSNWCCLWTQVLERNIELNKKLRDSFQAAGNLQQDPAALESSKRESCEQVKEIKSSWPFLIWESNAPSGVQHHWSAEHEALPVSLSAPAWLPPGALWSTCLSWLNHSPVSQVLSRRLLLKGGWKGGHSWRSRWCCLLGRGVATARRVRWLAIKIGFIQKTRTSCSASAFAIELAHHCNATLMSALQVWA